jgi:hypothetical protein
MELNGTHQLLVYSDNVNIVDENVNTMKTNTEAVLDAIRHTDFEVNTERDKYMVVSRNQNAGQSQNLLSDNPFAYVVKVKCFKER